MPKGGMLTIETVNASIDERYAHEYSLAPGQFVLIAVTDNGIGMPNDVLTKAFDPFFTTKGVGKGTGLGLSQVYGYVRQSGGHVRIYSEVDVGTTVKIATFPVIMVKRYDPFSQAASPMIAVSTTRKLFLSSRTTIVCVPSPQRP